MDNRKNCHRKYKVIAENPFITWLISNFATTGASIDALVGRAKLESLFPREYLLCTSTIYNAIWKGLITIKPTDLPEALRRKPRTNKSSR